MPAWLNACLIGLGIFLFGVSGLAMIFEIGIPMLGGQDKSGVSLTGFASVMACSGFGLSCLGWATAKKKRDALVGGLIAFAVISPPLAMVSAFVLSRLHI